MTDGEGQGVRAARAARRRGLVYVGIYAVVATALMVGLMMGTRDPAAGPPRFTPEAAVAGAVLLPLLTLVTMWVCLRMFDEVQRRIVIDAWAASFIVTLFGVVSWLFLIGGGLVPEPPGPVVLVTVLLGSAVAVMVAALWLNWRRS